MVTGPSSAALFACFCAQSALLWGFHQLTAEKVQTPPVPGPAIAAPVCAAPGPPGYSGLDLAWYTGVAFLSGVCVCALLLAYLAVRNSLLPWCLATLGFGAAAAPILQATEVESEDEQVVIYDGYGAEDSRAATERARLAEEAW